MPATDRLLELALKGLEAERARIDDEIAEVKRQLGSRTTGSRVVLVSERPARGRRRRRSMSAETKRKISEAMKRRYAAKKTAKK
jgi:hypothetical protein